jgi:hypothetical protein
MVKLLERGYEPKQSAVLARIERVLNEMEPEGLAPPSSMKTSTAGQGRHEQSY